MILPILSTHFTFYSGFVFIISMRAGIPIIGLGVIILVFGIVFFLQGNSIVGPTSSFMYSNPKWIGYGQNIAAIGIVIIAVGIWFSLRRPKS